MEYSFQPTSKHFGDYLIYHIAASNWPEIFHGLRILRFGYECQDRGIDPGWWETEQEKGLHRCDELSPYNRPSSYIELFGEAIWTWHLIIR